MITKCVQGPNPVQPKTFTSCNCKAQRSLIFEATSARQTWKKFDENLECFFAS